MKEIGILSWEKFKFKKHPKHWYPFQKCLMGPGSDMQNKRHPGPLEMQVLASDQFGKSMVELLLF